MMYNLGVQNCSLFKSLNSQEKLLSVLISMDYQLWTLDKLPNYYIKIYGIFTKATSL